MAAGTWKVYKSAKKAIGNGGITLGAGVFKMQLHRASASAAILVLSTRVLSTSVPGEISAIGGYAAHGRNIVPATGQWASVAGGVTIKFTYTSLGLVFTANGGNLNNIKYGLLRNSVSATGGKVLCFCTLSGTAFTVTTGNTLTITPNASGVFTLA